MPESSQKNDLRGILAKYAGRILSARPYFRFKLREKLFKYAESHGFEDSDLVIDSILEDLAKSGFLDDQYLAEAFVRRQLAKGYGPKIISHKLKYLGLGSEMISLVLKSSAGLEAETDSIKHFSRKFTKLDHRKLLSKLYFRGYSGQAIKKVFDEAPEED